MKRFIFVLSLLLISCAGNLRNEVQVWSWPSVWVKKSRHLKPLHTHKGESFAVAYPFEPTLVDVCASGNVIAAVRFVVVLTPHVRRNPHLSRVINAVIVTRFDRKMRPFWTRVVWDSKTEQPFYGPTVSVAPDSDCLCIQDLENAVIMMSKNGEFKWARFYYLRGRDKDQARSFSISRIAAGKDTLYITSQRERAVLLALINPADGTVRKAVKFLLPFSLDSLMMAVSKEFLFIGGVVAEEPTKSHEFLLLVLKRNGYLHTTSLFRFKYPLEGGKIVAGDDRAFLFLETSMKGVQGFPLLFCVDSGGRVVFSKQLRINSWPFRFFRIYSPWIAKYKDTLFIASTLDGNSNMVARLSVDGQLKGLYRFGVIIPEGSYSAEPTGIAALNSEQVLIFHSPIGGGFFNRRVTPPQRVEDVTLIDMSPEAVRRINLSVEEVSVYCTNFNLMCEKALIDLKPAKSLVLPPNPYACTVTKVSFGNNGGE